MGVENHPRPRQQCPVIAPTVALPAARHRVTCNQVDGKTGTHTNSVIKYSSERVFPEQFSNRFIPIVGRSVAAAGGLHTLHVFRSRAPCPSVRRESRFPLVPSLGRPWPQREKRARARVLCSLPRARRGLYRPLPTSRRARQRRRWARAVTVSTN